MGASNQGRADPVKASLKFDKTGLGHDPGAEFTTNWWEMAFNKAAKGIKVSGDGTDVQYDKVSKAEEKKELKNALYSRFVNVRKERHVRWLVVIVRIWHSSF